MVQILPTYPKAVMDLLEGLGRTVAGKMGVNDGSGGGGGGAAQPNGQRAAVLQAIQSDPGLTAQQRAALVGWLDGAPLNDPLLREWVTRVTGGAATGGIGSGATAGARAAVSAAAPGISAANDNGIGGGGPEGAAAQVAQQSQRAASSAASALPAAGAGGAAPPPVSTTAAPTSGSTLPTAPVQAGGVAPGTAEALLDNAKGVTARLAGNAAGVDIGRGGLAAQYFQKASNPVIDSLLKLMQYIPGGGDGSNINTPNVANVISQVAKMYTTPGADPAAWARQMAQQITGGADYMKNFAGLTEADQQDQLQALLGFRGAGASSYTANAMQMEAQRALGAYNDGALGLAPGTKFNQYGGNFANFLATPEGQKYASVFGIAPR